MKKTPYSFQFQTHLDHLLLSDGTVGARQGLEEEEVSRARQILAEQLRHASEHPRKSRLTSAGTGKMEKKMMGCKTLEKEILDGLHHE